MGKRKCKVRRLDIFLYCLAIGVLVYFNSPYHLKQHHWKSISGGRITDFMKFDDIFYKLKWPYIYDTNNEKVGCVVFCFYQYLWIYSYRCDEDGQKGADYGFGQYVGK